MGFSRNEGFTSIYIYSISLMRPFRLGRWSQSMRWNEVPDFATKQHDMCLTAVFGRLSRNVSQETATENLTMLNHSIKPSQWLPKELEPRVSVRASQPLSKHCAVFYQFLWDSNQEFSHCEWRTLTFKTQLLEKCFYPQLQSMNLKMLFLSSAFCDHLAPFITFHANHSCTLKNLSHTKVWSLHLLLLSKWPEWNMLRII